MAKSSDGDARSQCRARPRGPCHGPSGAWEPVLRLALRWPDTRWPSIRRPAQGAPALRDGQCGGVRRVDPRCGHPSDGLTAGHGPARFLVRGHRAGLCTPSRPRGTRDGGRVHRRRRIHRGLRRPAPRRAGVLGGRAGGGAGRVGGERTQRRAGRQRDARVDSRAGTVPRPGTRRDPLGTVRGGEGDHRGPHRPSRHRMRLAAGQPARLHPRALHGMDRKRGGVLSSSLRLPRLPDAVPRGDARGGRERELRRGTDGRGRRTPASASLRARDGRRRGAGRRPNLRGLEGRAGAMGLTRAGVHGGGSRRSGLRRPCRQRVPGSP